MPKWLIVVLVVAVGTVIVGILMWQDQGFRLMFYDLCDNVQPVNEALHCSTSRLAEYSQ